MATVTPTLGSAVFSTRREEQTVKPEIGLDDKDRQGVIDILNQLLADEYML